jgi:hypothetical protein
MKDWHERQAIPIDNFVISDGLPHERLGLRLLRRNCSATTSSSRSARSSSAVNVPSDVRAYRPM